ncbi:abortive infection family protein [Ferrimicrobium sp.]|uniref:abortive infection family protein n=1 Tax=Ferrimicrobium sp. TaxID=2926050 RepID=UPI002607F135|nr:abortive infection family protein [Ferrimicrobium sp.]
MSDGTLISPRTRREFQEHLVGFVVREIHGYFKDEGFKPGEDDPNVSGERRSLVASYYNGIDWHSPGQVRRVLNAYENILFDTSPEYRQKLIDCLRRDGYTVDDGCRIGGDPNATATDLPVGALSDPSVIREHLARINDSMDRDPAAAISGAKALIESTTKLVLEELQCEYDARADIPELVKLAQKALMLHPSQIAPTAKGSESIKRILSNLSQLAIGVAELRNEYGSDHGRPAATVGLGYRQVHLAVGSATVYCRLLLETLEDPKAPWRTRSGKAETRG